MRFLCFLFLLAFAGVAVILALHNQQAVTLHFFEWSVTANIAAVIGVAYLLGMLSGWTVVGMLRRSANRVLEGVENELASPRR